MPSAFLCTEWCSLPQVAWVLAKDRHVIFPRVLFTVDHHSAFAVALLSSSRTLVILGVAVPFTYFCGFGLQPVLGGMCSYLRCLGCLPRTVRLRISLSIHWWLCGLQFRAWWLLQSYRMSLESFIFKDIPVLRCGPHHALACSRVSRLMFSSFPHEPWYSKDNTWCCAPLHALCLVAVFGVMMLMLLLWRCSSLHVLGLRGASLWM